MTPRLRIDPFTTEGTSAVWTVRWQITNEDDRGVRLLTARQPHSQFSTPETRIDRDVAPHATTNLALPVRFTELPGLIVENPFLILVVRQEEEWRLLARVRVTAGARGEPLAGASVTVTTQRVGAP